MNHKIKFNFLFFLFQIPKFQIFNFAQDKLQARTLKQLGKKIMRVWNLDPISLNIKYLPSFFFSFFLFLLLFAFHFKNFEPKASNNRTMRFLSG